MFSKGNIFSISSKFTFPDTLLWMNGSVTGFFTKRFAWIGELLIDKSNFFSWISVWSGFPSGLFTWKSTCTFFTPIFLELYWKEPLFTFIPSPKPGFSFPFILPFKWACKAPSPCAFSSLNELEYMLGMSDKNSLKGLFWTFNCTFMSILVSGMATPASTEIGNSFNNKVFLLKLNFIFFLTYIFNTIILN